MYTQTKPDWTVTTTEVIVFCQSEKEARSRTLNEYRYWADWAARFRVPVAKLRCTVRGKIKDFPILATEIDDRPTLTTPTPSNKPTIITPGTVYNDLPIRTWKPELRQLFDQFAEADRPRFLLCNEPIGAKPVHSQVWLNQAAADVMRTPGDEACLRTIADFWDERDLESLETKLRDSSVFTHTYTCALDKPRSDRTAAWGRLTNRYETIEIMGYSFRVSSTIDFAEIASPVKV